MIHPDNWPPRLVYIMDLTDRSHPQEIGEVICTTKRDLDALRYALKHIEYIGIKVVETCQSRIRTEEMANESC